MRPMQSDRQRMTGQPPVGGEKFEVFFLSLNQEQFVEWVLVFKRCFERPCSVTCGHRQKDYILPFQDGDHVNRVEGVLTLARPMTDAVFQPHFPDRYGAHMQP